MKILEYKICYFLGVGGIGMSALARFFNHHKINVAGYDKTETALTLELEAEGISCHYEENVELLQKKLQGFQKSEVLIVYTPAVPKDHAEYIFLEENAYTIKKRSEVLGEITRSFKTIAIAGTHGKTTTTTLVTHLLKTAGINCYSFMGGISKNYHTNLLLGDPDKNDKAYVVVEADEYDRSFLTLNPYIAVVTSVDADHLDIYGNKNSVLEGYFLFTQKVQENGILIVKKNVDNELKLTRKRLIYSLNLNTEYCAGMVHIKKGAFHYNIHSPVEKIADAVIGLPGLHNVENSIAAVAIAQQLGIKGEKIKEALRSFEGVKRRFDYRVKSENVIYIDDYAHHPEELKATITAARQLYPGKQLTGIFQPHLFSRTRDFADDFAKSLDLLDECILLDIYPAREKPIIGVDSKMLLDKMSLKCKIRLKKENVLDYLKNNRPEVLLTMGAGDIDKLAEPIEKLLKTED